jgi:hypothetical protein
MAVLWEVLVVGLVAALLLVLMVGAGGIGTVELARWVAVVVVGLVVVAGREVRRGRRARPH